MKNKYKSYPEDKFDTHIAQVNTGDGFKCDEKYVFLPKGFFQKAFSYFLLFIALIVFTIYFRLFQFVKVKNKKNFKKNNKEGGVVIFNHVNFMDIVMIDALVTRFSFIKILTLEESFGVPVARFFMKYVLCVPIPSSFRANINFQKEMNKVLQNKGFIAVAPEGFLWPYYPGLRPFYDGAFRFAVKNNKPVFPMVVLFRKGRIRKSHVYPIIEVLEPLYPNKDLPFKECEEDLSLRCFNKMKETLENFYEKGTPYLHFNHHAKEKDLSSK